MRPAASMVSASHGFVTIRSDVRLVRFIESLLGLPVAHRDSQCDWISFRGAGHKDVEFPKEAREALVKGENVLAVTCRNLGGPQYIDVGIIEVVPAPTDDASGAEISVSGKEKPGEAKGASKTGAPKDTQENGSSGGN